MIPVKPAPEPAQFNEQVRIPGNEFLKKRGVAEGKLPDSPIKWSREEANYWTKCSTELEEAYNHICCYVAMRINNSLVNTEHRSVEHFIPKSVAPWLAYEWTNYRLACRKANSKRQSKDVLDPFKVGSDDFRLDMFSFELYPNPELSKERQKAVKDTIANVGLNDFYWVNNRRKYYLTYIEYVKNGSQEDGKTFLRENAPIVLVELERKVEPIIIDEEANQQP